MLVAKMTAIPTKQMVRFYLMENGTLDTLNRQPHAIILTEMRHPSGSIRVLLPTKQAGLGSEKSAPTVNAVKEIKHCYRRLKNEAHFFEHRLRSTWIWCYPLNSQPLHHNMRINPRFCHRLARCQWLSEIL